MINLSIIIVNWNTFKMLQECLNSIFCTQYAKKIQVIVIDNASTDGSPEMVASDFPHVVLIRNRENVGFARANNQGMAVARGDFVLLLNSDTVVLGDVLQRSVEFMQGRPDVGVMGCRVLNPDKSTQRTCGGFPSLANLALLTSGLSRLAWPAFFDNYLLSHWDRESERDVDVVTGCFMMVRAAALRQVGVMDEQFFFYGEETDWCRRFRDAGWRVCFAPVGEIIHHSGGSAGRLEYKADLMLSSAIVRLHLKYGGLLSAWAAWLLVLSFNTSRAIFWMIASLLSGDRRANYRRSHFFKLVINHGQVWPARRTKSV